MQPAKLPHLVIASLVGVGLISLSASLVFSQAPVVPGETQVEQDFTPLTQENDPTPAIPLPTPSPEATATNEPALAGGTEMNLVAMPTRYGDEKATQLLLVPGERQQFSLRVRNESTKPITVQSLVEDFVIGEDGVTPTPVESTEENNNRWSMASWITLTPAKQTIDPKSTAGVNVTIEVPEDALPGGKFVMIMHQPDTGLLTSTTGETTNVVNQRVGTLVYGVVDGDFIENAFIRDLVAPQLSEFGPIAYSFRVDNDSDVHIRPQLTVKIYNMWGKLLDTSSLETKNIFPKISRDFEGEWQQIWGLGRYKLEVAMMYGTTDTVTKIASTYFWIIPIKLILAIIFSLLVIITAVVLIRRHYLHRKNDQATKVKELEEKLAKLENNTPSSTPTED